MHSKILSNKKIIEMYMKNSYSYFKNTNTNNLFNTKIERVKAIKRFINSTR